MAHMESQHPATLPPEKRYHGVPSLTGNDPIFPADIMGHAPHLELEIGFGRGHFIRERAQQHPDVHILGIETKRKMVFEVAQKACAQGLSNLHLFFGDAREAVTRMQPAGCFQHIFIHFPDPWWKARHAKRMVVNPDMAAQIVRLLAPQGRCFVQTDVDFRAAHYRDVLLAQPQLRPLGDAGYVDENPFGARTAREKRAIEVDMPVYRLLFERT